jgi:type II secretory pathway pseudopilin PulG
MSRQPNTIIESQLKAKNRGGFSLIEVAIAMTTMGLALAYAMPLILYSKINNNKSEMRAGALVVSQKIFDDIRGRTFGSTSIPIVDTTITNNSTPVALTPDQTKALGRTYNVAVRYCETGTAASPTNECTADYRKFKITVRDTAGNQNSDSSIIYEFEAAFTSFK